LYYPQDSESAEEEPEGRGLRSSLRTLLQADYGDAGLEAMAGMADVASAEVARFYHGLVDMGR
jgi:hypothetical protein